MLAYGAVVLSPELLGAAYSKVVVFAPARNGTGETTAVCISG